MKIEEKQYIFDLRKQGKSYNEISNITGISKSTISNVLKNEIWSEKIKTDLKEKNDVKSKIRLLNLNKIRGDKLKEYYKQARIEALQEFNILNNNHLFIAGIVIYWGEGDKRSKNNFRITNTDPEMIKIFIKFLKDICNASEKRIRLALTLYEDLDDVSCKNYWSKELNFPLENFTKSMYIKGKNSKNPLKYGICTVNYSSRFLKEKMIIWIGLLSKYLLIEKADVV